MSTKFEYYEILGIERNASDAQIKKAYRTLAMKYHPDRNSDDSAAEEKFKEIGEAYEVLKDPQKRAHYDRFGHQEPGAGMAGAGFSHEMDLGDALRMFMSEGFGFDIFGGESRRGGRNRKQRGRDLQIQLKLTLEDIAKGVEKKVKINRQVVCPVCNGEGAEPGSKSTTCPSCQGAGEVRQVSNSFFGQFVNIQTCPRCNGEGVVIEKPCHKCRGEGRISGEDVVEIKVPAGVSTGNYLTLNGRGNVGLRGGPAGDLVVVMEEIEHDIFERHGDDILYLLYISFPQAVLGDDVEVPTLDGTVSLKIVPGMQSGKILRMKGRGIPRLRHSGKGDQLVQDFIWTPEKLPTEDKELMQKLAKSKNIQPPKNSKSFLKKAREAFR